MDGMRRMPPNRSFEMKKVVVFTGAGVSADSGLSTFRDADGLWADYRIEDVCTPEALRDNRAQVVDFYNMRRREMPGREPVPMRLIWPSRDWRRISTSKSSPRM